MRVKGCAQSCPQSLTRFIRYSRLLTLCGASLKMQIAMQGSYRQGTCFLGHHPRNADSAWCWAANTRVRSGTRGRCYELTREGRSEGHLLESKRSTTASQRELSEDIETVSMQADKLSKGAPGHPTNAHESQPVKTDIPNGDVSRKQSEMQKHNPVPTQIKQGSTVTLKQGGVDNSNTTSHIAQTGRAPRDESAGDQDGLTGGLGAVEVPEGMGAK